MASKKAAESTLYHLSPKGFWKKFRDAIVVNPEISSGLPIQGVHRYPPPGSRTEKYATPATKASDLAENPYWKRDVRRKYPLLSVVTQTELSQLLLGRPEGEATVKDSQLVSRGSLDLSSAITTITSKHKVYDVSKLPPALPTAYKRWIPERAPDAPHDPNAYFPMLLYK